MSRPVNLRRRTLPAAVIGALAIGALSSPVARAAGEADTAAGNNKAAAQALLLEGNALLQKGQAATALEKFTEARRQFPSPKIHYNIGQAEGLLPGHEAQAYQAMSRFLNEAKDASPTLRAAAETQRQASRPKVGLLFVTADPPAAEVILDDNDVGPPSADLPLVLAIGLHRVALRAPAETSGATSATETITVTGGDTFRLQLRLPPRVAVVPPPLPPVSPAPSSSAAVAATIAAPAPPPVSAPASGGWDWKRVTGASLLGLGAASLALGVVEHVRYFGKADDFRKNPNCGTSALTKDCAGLKSQFDSAHTWFIAGYVGAAVLGGAGAYLLWLAPASGPGEARSVASTGQGLTVGFQGSF